MWLAEHDPQAFCTQAIRVAISREGLNYQPVGAELSFSQMLALRQPLPLSALRQSSLLLANLGVSVHLTLNWQGQDYWLLVRQQRADRGDQVLKLISGYVPSAQLALPIACALQEITEECLIHNGQGWLKGNHQGQLLPYPPTETGYTLEFQTVSTPSIRCNGQALKLQPNAYIHAPSASLQLVYEARLQLPEGLSALSLFHADERFEKGRLITRLDPSQPDIFLLPVADGTPSKRLFSLQQGQLIEQPTTGLQLSEYFAQRQGWFVHDSRISWADWHPSPP